MKGLRLSSIIPDKTHQALKLHNWQIDNIVLLLNKYLDFLILDNNQFKNLFEISKIKQVVFLPVIKDDKVFDIAIRKTFEINDRKNRYKIAGEKFDENFVKGFKNDLIQYRKFLKSEIERGQIFNLIKSQIERQEQISDYNIILTAQSRLIIGLGSGSVLETSIKLHHIYGIPYIPASAIKGVLRAYKIWKDLADWDVYKFLVVEELIESYEKNKFGKIKSDLIKNIEKQTFDKKFKEIDNDLSNNEIEQIKEDLITYINNIKEANIKQIIEIFGNQQQKGKLIFFDAYPEDFKGFDVDIMNPHYPEYYNGDEPPADWQNPNPITFLTIPEGTTFRFFFKNIDVYNSNLKNDLKEAFENLGIGGKTALGYGILDTNEEI